MFYYISIDYLYVHYFILEINLLHKRKLYSYCMLKDSYIARNSWIQFLYSIIKFILMNVYLAFVKLVCKTAMTKINKYKHSQVNYY